MLLTEIKNVQLSTAALFERADNGDRDAQLIVEGIMSSLSDMGKKFVGAVKGKTKHFALALALAVPAMMPSLASAVEVEQAIGLLLTVEKMSDSEYLRYQANVVKHIQHQYGGMNKGPLRRAFGQVMDTDKDDYMHRLKERIDSALRGNSTIWKDESEMSFVLDTYWKVFRPTEPFDIDAWLRDN